jgi:hypothetical protein
MLEKNAKQTLRDMDLENKEHLVPVLEIEQASAQRIGESVG